MPKFFEEIPFDPEAKIKDPLRYRNVPGGPAFPPVSRQREEEYIQRMIERDKKFENGE